MPLKSVVESLDDLPAELQDHYTEREGKYYLQVDGMPTQENVARLESALAKVKAEKKQLGERLALLGEHKIEDVLAQLDRIPELEAAAAGKIDDDKLNEMVDGRLKSRVAPLEREKAQLAARLQELTETVSTYESRERSRKIQDAVREAISKAEGFTRSAEEDAMIYAERDLELSEDGHVQVRDGIGLKPTDGPAEWLAAMQAKKPHWWGPTTGGGATGNRSGGAIASNPWSAEGWNITEQMRIIKESAARAEQLARAAGNTVDGPRPAPKQQH